MTSLIEAMIKKCDELIEADKKRTQGEWLGVDFLADQKVNGHLAIYLGNGPLDNSSDHFGIFHTAELKEADQKLIALAANEAANIARSAKLIAKALMAECPCVNNYNDGICRCGIQDTMIEAAKLMGVE